MGKLLFFNLLANFAALIQNVYASKLLCRGVARGGQRPPQEFGRSANPIQTRASDYAPHTTASPPFPIQKAIYTSVMSDLV